MSFEVGKGYKKEAHEKSEPHPDASMNKSYFDTMWNSTDVRKRMDVFIKTLDSDGSGQGHFHKQYMGIEPYWENDPKDPHRQVRVYKELTGVQATWRKNGVNSGFSLGFHCKREEFEKECNRLLGVKIKESYKNWIGT